MLTAGMLEIVDREFSAISSAVEDHINNLDKPEKALMLLSTPSIRRITQTAAEKLKNAGFTIIQTSNNQNKLLSELNDYGIKTVEDLQKILNDDFLLAFDSHNSEDTTEFGLIRDAMMFENIEKYFELAYKSRWNGIDVEGVNMLNKKYGTDYTRMILDKYKIGVIDD